MKPVVVLTLIASALRGKPRLRDSADNPDAPLSGDEARHEVAIAVTAVIVALALILALVLSFFWAPEL